MKPPEETLDPRIAASLEAIDATLAGEAVDPGYAELAELALLLSADRPQAGRDFTLALDTRVGGRFAPASGGTPRPRAQRRWWLWTPAVALGAALALAVVIAGQPGSTPSGSASRAVASSRPASPARTPHTSAAPSLASGSPTPTSAASGSAASTSAASGSASFGPAPVLQPPSNGRKTVQGAQLALTATPARIDAVAQEVFVVVGQARGIVNNSTVTATSGPGAYAQFDLSIPSSVLPQTMAALSSLRYARVASRTDTSQDVNNQYDSAVRALADARALRTSLLKQLANASTQAQIDSLTAQIHDAGASISSDEATLRSLNNQVNYSQVNVTINGGVVLPVVTSGSGGGFTLGRAAHDAGRVLTVVAGVALIAAAVLVPLALLVALGWWIAGLLRRRRREQALDLV